MKCILLIGLCTLFLIPVQGQITPVPGVSHSIPFFDPQKATDSLIRTIPQAVRVKGNQYGEGEYWLILWNFLYAGFIAWLFIFGGLSSYIKKLAGKTAKPNRSNFIYISLYLLLSFGISLPIDFYQNFFREQQYGFSNQRLAEWFSQDLISFFVEWLILTPFLVLIYRLFRKVKENWWIWGASITVVFTAVVMIIYPVLIAPLFNTYAPLANGELRDEILSMARANQVKIDQVYVYNESKQTKALNANVIGLTGTARISINDNMLQECSRAEIKSILGHEMGHYVLDHLFILLLEFGILIVIAFWFVKVLLKKILARYGKRIGVWSVQQVTSLPVLVFLFTLYFFLITPLSNSMIRTVEIQADNYGLNAARLPDAFSSVCLKTADNHKVSPGYWEEIFFYDHPSRRRRILAAMEWKAENLVTKP